MTKNGVVFKNLRAYRDAFGLSQLEAARLHAVSQITWSRWERHVRTPSPKTAKRIAKSTGVPIEILLGIALLLLAFFFDDHFGSCL